MKKWKFHLYPTYFESKTLYSCMYYSLPSYVQPVLWYQMQLRKYAILKKIFGKNETQMWFQMHYN